ncbi:anthrax toxin-like adenylyl cyclase domain-containing protein [Nostoc sp. UHCC 0251]|uniref:anthrax toxin-like adenylyl cyclase domain-containing protein n=1 Tax=Nostoc sp. UHCC 0251 TaxID=3110240 RepID=UPI002B221414|nr:anthrax toxin-like adenylyl cyclase domain-containing protein [Nostoc sp. UHCC 0251]MEA5622222.1 anthrax toxin-like adenylyl cyclase domain-containing protein [Nostoc sp. UHCC 0251]
MPLDTIKTPVVFSKERLRDEQGFPPEHIEAFLTVAKEKACVILTRTPGSSCEGPLAEGYAAKSFHIKAKSCNWGATAGFLCLDPFMNKSIKEGALDNLKENFKSMTEKYEGKTANAIRLQISDTRLNWLITNKKLQGGYSPDKSYFIATSSTGEKDNSITVDFLLVRDQIFPELLIWDVYYDAGKLYGLNSQKPTSKDLAIVQENFLKHDKVKNKIAEKNLSPEEINKYFKTFWDKLVVESEKWPLNFTNNKKYNHYVPAFAVTNPQLEYDLGTMEGYKNAVTGDYDLFAVWPKIADKSLDSRVAGMTLNTTSTMIGDGEKKSRIGQVVGNISGRVYEIAQQLNATIMQKTVGSKSGVYAVNRVFHSDEAGRPYLNEVDEAAVFTPDGEIFMVSPDKDTKQAWQLSSLIRTCKKKGYTIYANVAWMKFLDDDVKNMVTWSEAVPETPQPVAAKK